MGIFIIIAASIIIGLLTFIALSLGSIFQDVYEIKKRLKEKGE